MQIVAMLVMLTSVATTTATLTMKLALAMVAVLTVVDIFNISALSPESRQRRRLYGLRHSQLAGLCSVLRIRVDLQTYALASWSLPLTLSLVPAFFPLI